MVAEPVQAAAAEPTTPTPEPTPAQSKSDTQVTPTGGVEETAAAVPETADPAEATGETGFRVEDLPEWKEAVSELAGEAKPREIPGDPVEEVARQQQAVRASNYARLMQYADNDIREFAQNDLGLSSNEAAAFWARVRPILVNMHGSSDDYYRELTHASAKAALPEPAYKALMSRQYKSTTDIFKAAYELGGADADGGWQEKVKAGEYVSKSALKKISDAAYNAGRGKREQAGEVEDAQSGTVARGATSGASYRTEHDLNVAFNNKQIDHAAYGREYKRLTGRDP